MNKDELTACQDKLEQVKKEFDDFVYLVSHDLKAPIRGIYNLAEWVAEDLEPGIPAGVQHNLNLLRNRTLRLDKMLNAILELSRVNRMHLQVETIALTPFLNRIKDSYANEQVSFSIPENLPALTTYSAKLQTVMEHLFDNAVKHNPDQNLHISVTCRPDPEFLKLLVADNGAGIMPEQRDKIFNIFYTGQSKEESSSIGAGLTIIKRIADFVGGNIELIKSTSSGSTFLLTWPFRIIQKP